MGRLSVVGLHAVWQLPPLPLGSLIFGAGAVASAAGVLWMLPYWRSHWGRAAEVYLVSFATGMICWLAWAVLAAQTAPGPALIWQRWATVWQIPYEVAIWRAQYVVYRTEPPAVLRWIQWGSFAALGALLLPPIAWARTAALNPDRFWTVAQGMTGLAWGLVVLAHLGYAANFWTFTGVARRVLAHDPVRRRLYPALGVVSLFLYGSDHLAGYVVAVPWYPIGGLIGVCWVLLVGTEFRLHLLDDQRAIAVDSLTGCLTRGYGLWQAQEWGQQQPLGLLFVDADHFKHVNDTLGHAAGDAVIAAIGAACQQAVRRQDAVIRMGGDEFVVVMPGITQVEWPAVADRVTQQLTALPMTWEGQTWTQSLSVGRAWMPAGGDVDAALAQGDQAMYAAKAQHHAEQAPCPV